MPRSKTIGILGGMGPRATAHFLSLYVREMNLYGVVQDHNFPRMIMLSLPLAGWSVRGADDKAEVRKQVVEGAEFLARAGADVIAIPCNSVHEFYADVRARCDALDIIYETRRWAEGKSIGVLCSRQTREANLYGEDISYHPDQDAIDGAIEGVINGWTPSIDQYIHDLMCRGSEVVIIGCTELSLCKRSNYGLTVDSSWALARALALVSFSQIIFS